MKKKNIFWGLFFIIMAVVVLGSELNLFDTAGWFPVIVTGFLLAISISNLLKINFFGILVPLAIAASINSDILGIPKEPFAYIFSAVLLSIGLSIVFKGQRHKRRWKNSYSHIPDDDAFEQDSAFTKDDAGTHHNDDVIRISQSMNDSTRYVKSENFTAAKLKVSLGSLKVYFDQASFNPNGSTIDFEVSLGAIVLYLPRNLNVRYNVEETLGKFEYTINHPEPDAPTLIINGDVSLGSGKVYFI